MKTPQEKNVIKAVAIVGALLLLWFFFNRRNAVALPPTSTSLDGPDWTQMFYQNTPGVLDSSVNNGPTFNTNNSVEVNTVDYGKLAGGYFPMFGYVGMTAVGN